MVSLAGGCRLLLLVSLVLSGVRSRAGRRDGESCAFRGVGSCQLKTCDVCCCCVQPSKTIVICEGPNVTDVPENLPLNTTDMYLIDTGIVNLTSSMLYIEELRTTAQTSQFYRFKMLQSLTFEGNAKLARIEPGALQFHGKTSLAHLTILRCHNLKHIPDGALGYFGKLETLRITDSGLESPPGWMIFYNHDHVPLEEMDLSRNNILELNNRSFSALLPGVGKLIISQNPLERIIGTPFYNTTIRKIILNKNYWLNHIGGKAFAYDKKKSVGHLEYLDLSESKITSLPTEGLNRLTHLYLNNTWSLKIFPQVIRFLSLTFASLTYSQHCCAFKHPNLQNMEEYAEFLKAVEKDCAKPEPKKSVISMDQKPLKGGYTKTTSVPRQGGGRQGQGLRARVTPRATEMAPTSAGKWTGEAEWGGVAGEALPGDGAWGGDVVDWGDVQEGDEWGDHGAWGDADTGQGLVDPGDSGEDAWGDPHGDSAWHPLPHASNTSQHGARKRRHKFMPKISGGSFLKKFSSLKIKDQRVKTENRTRKTPIQPILYRTGTESYNTLRRTKRDQVEGGVHVMYLGNDDWHEDIIDPNQTHILQEDCGINGSVETLFKETQCIPATDELNPCEDLMGFPWLRVIVWLVVITAFFGNLVVLLVTMCSKHKLTVAKFLMCNLAFADLTLGAYLMMLAVFDSYSKGVYFTYAFPWQYEGGCQAAGFLAIFSTCLSVFTLTVITMERWYAISHAIHLNKRLRLKQASCIMVGGWCFAIVAAVLPLVGISSYSVSAICLPMDVSSKIGLIYVSSLLLVNAVAFFIMCWCYINMYMKVTGNETGAGRNDVNIAKRMAFLVFTDFACLFPIAFFGLTAAFGKDIITVTEAKILLVFFFPLNSCFNPFLYAILTKQFKKDFFEMLSRFGVCEKRAARYRMIYLYTSNPMSLSHSRSGSVQHQLGHRVHRPSDAGGLPGYFTDTRAGKMWPEQHKSPACSPDEPPGDSYFHRCTNNMSAAIPSEVVTTAAVEGARRLSIVPEGNSASDESHRSEENGARGSGRRQSDIPVRKTVRSVSQYNTNNCLSKKHGGGPTGNGIQLNKRKESQSTMVTMLSTTTTETSSTEASVFTPEPNDSTPEYPSTKDDSTDESIKKQDSVDSVSDAKGNIHHLVAGEDDDSIDGDQGVTSDNDLQDGEEK